MRFEEVLSESDGVPLLVPRELLDITLQQGTLAFQLHPDFEERIEEELSARVEQEHEAEEEEDADPVDKELENLDSVALRDYTLQQRERRRQGFMAQATALNDRSQRTRAPRKRDADSYMIEWKKTTRKRS